MKKQLKKLNLNKETLRNLEEPDLKDFVGGLTTDPCITNRRSCLNSNGGAGGNTCCTQYC